MSGFHPHVTSYGRKLFYWKRNRIPKSCLQSSKYCVKVIMQSDKKETMILIFILLLRAHCNMCIFSLTNAFFRIDLFWSFVSLKFVFSSTFIYVKVVACLLFVIRSSIFNRLLVTCISKINVYIRKH